MAAKRGDMPNELSTERGGFRFLGSMMLICYTPEVLKYQHALIAAALLHGYYFNTNPTEFPDCMYQ